MKLVVSLSALGALFVAHTASAQAPVFPVNRDKVMSCAALASSLPPGIKLRSYLDSPLGQVRIALPYTAPPHCMIAASTGSASSGPYASNIDFVIRLPYKWNGNFFFQGGGGTDGFDGDAYGSLQGKQKQSALERGYAVASTDSGHDLNLLEGLDTLTHFGVDAVLRKDYAYRSVQLVTSAAKAMINKFYAPASGKPDHSFFVGCSNGGRQAMLAATRFAADFDGVLAGAPAMKFTSIVMQGAPVAKTMQTDPLTKDELNTVSERIVERCDALDGSKDGLVLNTKACDQNISAYTAACGIVPGACLGLWPWRFALLKDNITGPQKNGIQYYPTLPWDPSFNAASFRSWRVEQAFVGPTLVAFGAQAIPEVASAPPALQCSSGLYTMDASGVFRNGTQTITPAACEASVSRNFAVLQNVDLAQLRAAMGATFSANIGPAGYFGESGISMLDVPTPSNLTSFRDGRGKLIVFSGTADPAVSFRDLTGWYDALKSRDATAERYATFFPVPGMSHCGGGRSTDEFDLFTPLERWVKDGQSTTLLGTPGVGGVVAKTRIKSNGDLGELNNITRERPLCPYPQYAAFDGTKYVCSN
jgi:Tannase and feruloyl esterase